MVRGLLTTLSAQHDRVSMHGVRREVLEAQARCIGLPLQQVVIGPSMTSADSAYLSFPTNDTYEQAMLAALSVARERGIEGVVFGDIFLEDLREYRDRLLTAAGVSGVYPLWKMSNDEVLQRFGAERLQALVVCIDEAKLDESWLGRRLDSRFRAELPRDVDACGENGEFHTLVYDGSIFRSPLRVVPRAIERRPPFRFLDLGLES